MGRPLVRGLLLGSFLSLLLASVGCGGPGAVRHSDYGECHRQGRHMHNGHVFIGDHHDHSLCEWEALH